MQQAMTNCSIVASACLIRMRTCATCLVRSFFNGSLSDELQVERFNKPNEVSKKPIGSEQKSGSVGLNCCEQRHLKVNNSLQQLLNSPKQLDKRRRKVT
jgi:hypothetical protein